WVQITDHGKQSEWHIEEINKLVRYTDNYSCDVEVYPAPTAEEFSFEDYISKDGALAIFKITKAEHHWRVNYYDYLGWALIDYDKLGELFPVNDHKLCEVMASVKLWLKKKGYTESGG
ncbi:MAG: hypothetical protein PHT07_24955, partial [Paludibacter sp.]|nr:hypothetical protein [Paludibacter sp.]